MVGGLLVAVFQGLLMGLRKPAASLPYGREQKRSSSPAAQLMSSNSFKQWLANYRNALVVEVQIVSAY